MKVLVGAGKNRNFPRKERENAMKTGNLCWIFPLLHFFLALAESYGMICDGMFHIFHASGYGDELSEELLHEWLDVDIKTLFFCHAWSLMKKVYHLFD